VVNGEQITFQQYQQAYDRAFQRLSDQFGGNVPKGLAETFGIKQQVIMQLIQTELLRQGAEKMGLQVSAEEIRLIIEGMVQFQEDGVFNIERYKAVLAANRMAPTKFEDTMRFDRLSEVAVREISNFANVVTDFEIQEVYSQQNEKVAVKYIKISPEQFVDQVTIDDKALMTWFETVKENYKTDPQVKLKYLTFTYDNVGRKIDIDSSKIEEYYRNNIEEFQDPEQRHARHIILQATEEDSPERHQEQARKAEEILELAKKGQDFSALAQEYSEGPSKDSGGDLGFFSEGQMVPSFNRAVFNMQPGEISEVVKTQFGYHIIMLEEIQEAKTRPLEEVTAEVKTLLQRKEAENLAFQVANDAYEGIIRAGSLTKYAEENPGISIEQTDFISKSNAPADLKQDTQFLNKAFELNKGELSSLIKGQSGYAIFFVEDVKVPQIPAFETIRDTLVEDYKKAESIKMAETAANIVLKELHEGKELEELAQKIGVTVLESRFLTRSEQNENTAFPATLLEEVFLLSSSSPLPEKPGKVGSDVFVYTFLEREIPAMPEDDDIIETYRTNLLRLKQQQLLSSWLRHQEIKAEITTHPNI
jgi:peptidyl-prolyl cis-trans isomerase D